LALGAVDQPTDPAARETSMAEPPIPLDANLAALAARAPESAAALRGESGTVRLKAGTAVPEALMATRDGRWVRLHSTRDPVSEARQLVAAALDARQPPDLVVVVGAGCGYVLDQLAARAPEARVVVVEPDPGLLALLLASRDCTASLASGRLHFLTGPDYAGMARLSSQLSPPAYPPAVIVNPVVLREWPDTVAQARDAIGRLLFNVASNEQARMRLAAPYLRNTLRNLPRLLEEADVDALFGTFADVPAVIVGAGPSLDRNIANLVSERHRLLIIATDTAVRPLSAAGLVPDLVVVVDPGPLNARHFEGLPVSPSTFLVAEPGIAPSSWAAFAGRTFAFRVGAAEPWPWLRAHGIAPGVLSTWGSVATCAFDLAVRAGCNPVGFAGMDLAYTGGRPYCRGTTWETDWARFLDDRTPTLEAIWAADLARKPLVWQTGIDGVNVATTPTLLAFRDWLVAATSRHPDRVFVNLTGAGVLAGPAIHQAGARESDAWLPPGRFDPPGSRLAAAWRRGRMEAPRRASCLHALLDTAPDRADASREPWAGWLPILGSREEAIDLWLELARHAAPSRPEPIEAGERLAESLVASRDFDRALAALDWLDARRPTPRTRYLRGYCLQMSGRDPRAALRLYVEAATDPKCRFWAMAHRALLLADAGEVADASVSLEAALAVVPHLTTPAAKAIVEAVQVRIAAQPDASLTLTAGRP
jgi:hypothetical protein